MSVRPIVGLIAPELILILIGDKWLPMVDSLRILLVAFVFESVGKTFSQLLLAMGFPGLLVKIRLVQLAVLSAGILAFGQYGLIGIAAKGTVGMSSHTSCLRQLTQ